MLETLEIEESDLSTNIQEQNDEDFADGVADIANMLEMLELSPLAKEGALRYVLKNDEITSGFGTELVSSTCRYQIRTKSTSSQHQIRAVLMVLVAQNLHRKILARKMRQIHAKHASKLRGRTELDPVPKFFCRGLGGPWCC
jgi:hypothetical protein